MTPAAGGSSLPRVAVRAGLGGAALWLVLEFTTRYTVLLGSGGFLLATGGATADDLRGPLGLILNAAAAGAAMVLLGTVFYRRSVKEGARTVDLGYEFTRRALLAGAVGGVVLMDLLEGTHSLDELVFSRWDLLRALQPTEEEELRIAGQVVVALALVLIPANGILTPLVEEFAWRGYVQSRLVAGWGAGAGILVTAACFAAKHMIIDLSIGRASTLIVGSLVLGLVRHRWGTGASTMTHLLLNLVSSLRYLLAAAATVS